MSATVLIFWHAGVTTAAVASGNRYATDSVAMLKQPYIGRAAVTTGTGDPQASTAAPAGTKIAYVQVLDGKQVHFECNPENRSTVADSTSPVLSGSTQFEAGPGWAFSFLERISA